MNIIEALDAPELLGSAVLEFDDPSWDRWKVWLEGFVRLGHDQSGNGGLPLSHWPRVGAERTVSRRRPDLR